MEHIDLIASLIIERICYNKSMGENKDFDEILSELTELRLSMPLVMSLYRLRRRTIRFMREESMCTCPGCIEIILDEKIGMN